MKRAGWILGAGVLIGYLIGSFAGARAERLACDARNAEVAILAFRLERRANAITESIKKAESVAVIWHDRAAYFQQLYVEEWNARRGRTTPAGLLH